VGCRPGGRRISDDGVAFIITLRRYFFEEEEEEDTFWNFLAAEGLTEEALRSTPFVSSTGTQLLAL
jgi:hypothetical protein